MTTRTNEHGVQLRIERERLVQAHAQAAREANLKLASLLAWAEREIESTGELAKKLRSASRLSYKCSNGYGTRSKTNKEEMEMLVLSRKDGEEIIIGTGDKAIRVVVHLNGSRVRIGIAAPRDVPVKRGELKDN